MCCIRAHHCDREPGRHVQPPLRLVLYCLAKVHGETQPSSLSLTRRGWAGCNQYGRSSAQRIIQD